MPGLLNTAPAFDVGVGYYRVSEQHSEGGFDFVHCGFSLVSVVPLVCERVYQINQRRR